MKKEDLKYNIQEYILKSVSGYFLMTPTSTICNERRKTVIWLYKLATKLNLEQLQCFLLLRNIHSVGLPPNLPHFLSMDLL